MIDAKHQKNGKYSQMQKDGKLYARLCFSFPFISVSMELQAIGITSLYCCGPASAVLAGASIVQSSTTSRLVWSVEESKHENKIDNRKSESLEAKKNPLDSSELGGE